MSTINKFIAYAALGLVCCFAFAACGGDEPTPGPITPVVPEPEEATLTLTMTPATVKAGEDVTSFKVTNSAGKDVTSEVRFFGPNDLSVPMPWSTGIPGEYAFKATLGKEYSEPFTVTVTKSGDENYNFKRRVLIADFTGSFCGPCVSMTKALNNLKKNYPDVEVMACHVDVPSPDPLKSVASQAMWDMYAASKDGTPQAHIEFRSGPIGSMLSSITSHVKTAFNKFPAACGIKIASTVEGKTVKADVTVRFATSSKFRICAALLQDGMAVPSSYEGTYNEVLRSFGTPIDGKDIGAKAGGKGEEYTDSFTLEIPDVIGIPGDASKCHVMVYVMAQSNTNAYSVNNVSVCKAGESVDFEYAE